jgi:hypothetical protein
MRRIFLHLTCFLLGLMGLMMTPLVWAASDTPLSLVLGLTSSTLKGITAVKVSVGDFDFQLNKDNAFLKDVIEIDTRLKLKIAGITVSSTATEVLFINVRAIKFPFFKDNTRTPVIGPVDPFTPLYAVTAHLELVESVALHRNPSIVAPAATWERQLTAIVVGLENLGEIQAYVAHLVDQFINAYLEQNPKR